MIIDLLNNYPINEQDKILDAAKRWYAQQHHHRGSKIDLYDVFPDAPYIGEDGFDEWFEKILSSEKKEWIENINEKFTKQKKLFDDDKKWCRLFYNEDISLKLLMWLDKNNITYCIIKGLLDFADHLYIKTLQLPVEYYVLFTTNPRRSQLEYAIDNYGWVKYNVGTLINDTSAFKVHEAMDWIRDNSLGIIHFISPMNDNLYFELEEDAAAIKLRWAEYEI